MSNLTHIFSWLWKASRGYRLSIFSIGLVSTMSVAVAMLNVWVSKRLIDIATHNAEGNLVTFIIIFASCALAQILFSIIISKIEIKTEVSLRNSLRHKYFAKIMESRWLGKEAFHTGDMLSRLDGDVAKIADTLSRTMPAVIATAIQLIAALFFLGSMDWRLTLVVLLIMPAAILLSRAYVSRMRRLTNDIRTTDSRIYTHLQENIQHRVLITSFENTDQAIESLGDYHDDLQRQTITRNNYNLFSRSIVNLGFSAGYVTAFSWGVTGIASGAITFGTMAAFLQLVGQIQRPISRMSRQFATAVHTVASVDRLCELELPQEIKGEPIRLEGQVGVRLADVDFTYPDGTRKTIDAFSYDFAPGSLTAVVGETGIGKSTLIRLMLALLSPDKGKITFYNAQTEVEISPRTRCNIVYVPQGNTLVSGTIRDNLLMGKPDATDQDMREALYTAVAEFVHDLPDGLDTVCGEKGAGLSEGQAQRIAIARALLRPGGVILLDEPTSALDSQTEQTLIQRIRARLEGRTLIMVTHNEQTAQLCMNKVLMS
jgi:ABC-type bacteriocin/lantibiotic exporter with double-glycine peptidase domain